MADISKFKLNDPANIELPNSTTKFISKGNTKIDKISDGAEYRMNEQFQNFLLFRILIIFQIKKKI